MSTKEQRDQLAVRRAFQDHLGLVQRVPDMYRQLVMDTPEQQRLHDQVTEQADKAIRLMDALIVHMTPEADAIDDEATR